VGVDWSKAVVVACTGIVSVFLALGILNVAVSAAGYIFRQFEKRQMEKAGSSSK
jgi:Na+-transporting methylmalonyl-CoA/oxaloacetate decarboxylase gamma subunit